MLKLLRSNLLRMTKSAVFWIFFGVYALYSILLPIIASINIDAVTLSIPEQPSLLSLCYGAIGIPIPGIVITIICCVFFSQDFQNGTIRNKINIGHTRTQIYLANLLTMAIVALAMQAIYLLFFSCISLPVFGKVALPAKNMFLLLLDGTLMLLAYCAISTSITMTCKRPLPALLIAIVCLLFVTIIADTVCLDVLNWFPRRAEPSTESMQIVNQATSYVNTAVAYNRYDEPSKSLRSFCQFVLDCFPSGQSARLSDNPNYRWQPALYSLGWIISTTGAGIAIFKKSNLK